MTEHSIEELGRQLAQARAALREAQDRKAAAQERLEEAMKAKLLREIEARGVVLGKTKVRAFRRSWNGEYTPHEGPLFIIGVKVDFWGRKAVPVFAKPKKDGTASRSPLNLETYRWEIITDAD